MVTGVGFAFLADHAVASVGLAGQAVGAILVRMLTAADAALGFLCVLALTGILLTGLADLALALARILLASLADLALALAGILLASLTDFVLGLSVVVLELCLTVAADAVCIVTVGAVVCRGFRFCGVIGGGVNLMAGAFAAGAALSAAIQMCGLFILCKNVHGEHTHYHHNCQKQGKQFLHIHHLLVLLP